MKNVRRSVGLSAANTAAATARGYWVAEAQRQQKVLAAQTARAFGLTAAAKKRAPATRRAK